MMLSPLQLEGYYLKEVRFALTDLLETRPKGAVELGNIVIDISSNAVPQVENRLKWRCEVTVQTKEESKASLPYSFLIHMLVSLKSVQNIQWIKLNC